MVKKYSNFNDENILITIKNQHIEILDFIIPKTFMSDCLRIAIRTNKLKIVEFFIFGWLLNKKAGIK